MSEGIERKYKIYQLQQIGNIGAYEIKPKSDLFDSIIDAEQGMIKLIENEKRWNDRGLLTILPVYQVENLNQVK